MPENYDEISRGFSISWLGKLKQVTSLSKMTDWPADLQVTFLLQYMESGWF